MFHFGTYCILIKLALIENVAEVLGDGRSLHAEQLRGLLLGQPQVFVVNQNFDAYLGVGSLPLSRPSHEVRELLLEGSMGSGNFRSIQSSGSCGRWRGERLSNQAVLDRKGGGRGRFLLSLSLKIAPFAGTRASL